MPWQSPAPSKFPSMRRDITEEKLVRMRLGGCGFKHEFDVPFARLDVWKELLVPESPLGVPSSIKVAMVKEGKAPEQPISLGAVREMVMTSQWKMVSVVVECHEGEILVWELLSQIDAEYTLCANGDRKPRTFVALADAIIGTHVTIGFDCDYIETRSGGCCPPDGEKAIKQSLTRAPQIWHKDMMKRGYQALKPPEQSLGDGFEIVFYMPHARADIYREVRRRPSRWTRGVRTFLVWPSSMRAHHSLA